MKKLFVCLMIGLSAVAMLPAQDHLGCRGLAQRATSLIDTAVNAVLIDPFNVGCLHADG